MPVRSNDELKSNLSTFIPLMIAGKHASVRCPHCDGEFQIEGKRWRQPLMSVVKSNVEIKGRSCPYCMKVSLIPLEFFPKKVRVTMAAERQ
jgi:uncharacterized Zn-finger protein